MSRGFYTIYSVILICFFAATANAQTKECGKRELSLKNCQLVIAPNTISFWKDKFSVNDGVNRDLADMPLVAEKIEWVTARLSKTLNRHFIEFVIWDEPDETGIQTKMWYVYELNHEKANLKLAKPLYKRLLVEGKPPKSDKVKKFGLEAKNKEIHWYLDRERGLLK